MRLGEKGYLYIELLVAITIATLIAGAATMAVFQILKNTERNNNRMTAVRQVQNAGYWISRDTQIAQGMVAANLTQPDFLILSWTEGISGDNYLVIYTLEDMPGSEAKQLLRSQSMNAGANSTALVAQHIDSDPAKTKCELTSGTLSLTITSTVGDGPEQENETRKYQLVPRPGQPLSNG